MPPRAPRRPVDHDEEKDERPSSPPPPARSRSRRRTVAPAASSAMDEEEEHEEPQQSAAASRAPRRRAAETPGAAAAAAVPSAAAAAAPAVHPPPPPSTSNLSSLTVPVLRSRAHLLGLSIPSSFKKAQIIAAINAARDENSEEAQIRHMMAEADAINAADDAAAAAAAAPTVARGRRRAPTLPSSLRAAVASMDAAAVASSTAAAAATAARRRPQTARPTRANTASRFAAAAAAAAPPSRWTASRYANPYTTSSDDDDYDDDHNSMVDASPEAADDPFGLLPTPDQLASMPPSLRQMLQQSLSHSAAAAAGGHNYPRGGIGLQFKMDMSLTQRPKMPRPCIRPAVPSLTLSQAQAEVTALCKAFNTVDLASSSSSNLRTIAFPRFGASASNLGAGAASASTDVSDVSDADWSAFMSQARGQLSQASASLNETRMLMRAPTGLPSSVAFDRAQAAVAQARASLDQLRQTVQHIAPSMGGAVAAVASPLANIAASLASSLATDAASLVARPSRPSLLPAAPTIPAPVVPPPPRRSSLGPARRVPAHAQAAMEDVEEIETPSNVAGASSTNSTAAGQAVASAAAPTAAAPAVSSPALRSYLDTGFPLPPALSGTAAEIEERIRAGANAWSPGTSFAAEVAAAAPAVAAASVAARLAGNAAAASQPKPTNVRAAIMASVDQAAKRAAAESAKPPTEAQKQMERFVSVFARPDTLGSSFSSCCDEGDKTTKDTPQSDEHEDAKMETAESAAAPAASAAAASSSSAAAAAASSSSAAAAASSSASAARSCVPLDLAAVRALFAKLHGTHDIVRAFSDALTPQLQHLFSLLWLYLQDQAEAEEALGFEVSFPKPAGTGASAASSSAATAAAAGAEPQRAAVPSRKRGRSFGPDAAAMNAVLASSAAGLLRAASWSMLDPLVPVPPSRFGSFPAAAAAAASSASSQRSRASAAAVVDLTLSDDEEEKQQTTATQPSAATSARESLANIRERALQLEAQILHPPPPAAAVDSDVTLLSGRDFLAAQLQRATTAARSTSSDLEAAMLSMVEGDAELEAAVRRGFMDGMRTEAARASPAVAPVAPPAAPSPTPSPAAVPTEDVGMADVPVKTEETAVAASSSSSAAAAPAAAASSSSSSSAAAATADAPVPASSISLSSLVVPSAAARAVPLSSLIVRSFLLLMQLPQLSDSTSLLNRELWSVLAAMPPSIHDDLVSTLVAMPHAVLRTELLRWVQAVQDVISVRVLSSQRNDTALRACIKVLALFHRINAEIAQRERESLTALGSAGPSNSGGSKPAVSSLALDRSAFLNETLTSMESMTEDYRLMIARRAAEAAKARAAVLDAAEPAVVAPPAKKARKASSKKKGAAAAAAAAAAAEAEAAATAAAAAAAASAAASASAASSSAAAAAAAAAPAVPSGPPPNPNAVPVVERAQFCFTSFPFLMDASALSRIVIAESQREQQESVRSELEQLMGHSSMRRGGGMHFHLNMLHSHAQQGNLMLNVRRTQLIPDTLEQIGRLTSADLKKPLKIQFAGEEGIDAGGVKREYFQLLFQQLFSLEFNMFQDSSDLLVINPTSLISHDNTTQQAAAASSSSSSAAASGAVADLSAEAKLTLSEFELVGLCMGIALYNNVHLDLSFPLSYYRKLLHEARSDDPQRAPLTYTLNDLAEIHPETAKGLHLLSIHPASDAGEFASLFPDMTFSVDFSVFGAVVTRDLIPDGRNVAVTLANRAAYVQAYCRFLLHDSIALQFDAMARGFFRVASKAPFSLLSVDSPHDLELLLCGNKSPRFEDLEGAATYDGFGAAAAAMAMGAHGGLPQSLHARGRPALPVIGHFWSWFHESSVEIKRRLLAFVTGSSRIPIKGLAHATFQLVYGGEDQNKLPESHTCFAQLVLPNWKTPALLREKMMMALSEGGEGFALK